MKKAISIFLFFCFCSPAFSQEPDPQKAAIIEQRIELIAESLGDEEVDLTTVFDALNNYYDHPINLNRTSQEELEELMLLTEIQINNLLQHIDKNGKLISIYELQSVPGFDLDVIRNILPFVKVMDNFNSPHISIKEMLKDGEHELFLRWVRTLEQQAGYAPIADTALAQSPNSRYLGSPDRLYSRYRFRFGTNVSWGITGEKDPGEQFFAGAQKNGFDFYSAHLFLRNISFIKALAIGDYQVSFGQGLTFATGLAMGKNANTLGLKRNSNSLRPFTSVDENQFMRGAALTVGIKKWELTAMYSRQRVDANRLSTTDSNAVDDGMVVSSFQTSGLHSTPGEIEDKNAVLVSHYGGHVAWKTRKINIGATAVYSQLGGELNKTPTIYNQYDFRGTENLVTGIDFNYIFRNLNFFGEFSRSLNGGLAMQTGVIAAIDPKFSLSILYRNYAKDYQSLYANALAEGSKPVNERGIFIGLEAKPTSTVTINAYFDTFESLWLKSSVNGPSQGMELLGQIWWKPSKKMDMYFRVRHRNKPSNTSEDVEGIEFLTDHVQDNYRYQFTSKVTESVTLRTRVEMLKLNQTGMPTETGYLFYQDLVCKPLSSPFSITARYAVFDTDSYNSRIYAYENDVLYYFSIPSYYYRGSRIYGMLRYQFKKRVDIWIRYGQWLYNNRTTVNSGLNEISGNRKSEIKVQIRLRF